MAKRYTPKQPIRKPRRAALAARTTIIASGQTTSAVVDQTGGLVSGIALPAAFTGASVSFTVCGTEGGTYQALYDETNTLVSLTVAVSRSYILPAAIAAWPYFKIVSASAEGADRTIGTIVRSV